jgi:hypothetical protein
MVAPMSTTTTTPQAPPATGWEADAPVGDTVVRRFVEHEAAHLASAATHAGGRVERSDDLALADTGRPCAFHNVALLTQPPAPDAWDDVVARADRFFDVAGTGPVHLLSPWLTPDLSGHGWQLQGHPPLLVRQPGGRVPAAADADIVEVTDQRRLDDWARVAVDGFPLPDAQPFRPGALLGPGVLTDPRWRLWVAYVDGSPASIGTSFVSHGLAQLALGVTLPQARGHGLWYGLVRRRLLAAPHLLAGGLFSDDSRPGIERLGFLPITRFTLWRRPRRGH